MPDNHTEGKRRKSEAIEHERRARDAGVIRPNRNAPPDHTEAGERHNALVYARKHLKTHIAWRDYLKAGGELPAEEVGDLEHQEQAIAELNTICRVLRKADQ